MKRFIRLAIPVFALFAVSGAVAQPQQAGLETVEDTRRALAEAQVQGEAAKTRADDESLTGGLTVRGGLLGAHWIEHKVSTQIYNIAYAAAKWAISAFTGGGKV